MANFKTCSTNQAAGCKQALQSYIEIPCNPKIFEKIVSDKLMPLINKSSCENQHGFRQGRSTITNLILFSNFIHKHFSNRLQTDVIFTDFAKAFDKVDHPTLLAKLNILGMISTILNWISSYIAFRFQCVVINSTSSYKSSSWYLQEYLKVAILVPHFSCALLMTCLLKYFWNTRLICWL